jgi:hypothetical protein
MKYILDSILGIDFVTLDMVMVNGFGTSVSKRIRLDPR